jgi:hypothetical protein
MGKKSRSGSGIRIRGEHPGSYFRELRNNFRVKILKFFDTDADPGIFLTLDPGWKKIRIRRDKQSGSATLIAIHDSHIDEKSSRPRLS